MLVKNVNIIVCIFASLFYFTSDSYQKKNKCITMKANNFTL